MFSELGNDITIVALLKSKRSLQYCDWVFDGTHQNVRPKAAKLVRDTVL